MEPPAGDAWHGWVCPPGPFAELPFEPGSEAEQVAGVPLDDGFNEGNVIILEGPVWYAEELYFSEVDGGPTFVGPGLPGSGGAGSGGADGGGGQGGLGSGANGSGGAGSGSAAGTGGSSGPGSGGQGSGEGGTGGLGSGGSGGSDERPAPAGRVLKLSADDQVSVVLPDAGSNGLAVDPAGTLTLCSHGSGAVVSWASSSGFVPLVDGYLGERFNSPNDLAFGPDGSLYFSDPSYQAPRPQPQEVTRVYRVAPGQTEAVSVADDRRQPNGVSLSISGTTLYLSGEDGVFAHPLSADGALGTGVAFATEAVNRSDGMGIDCAGNVYLTSGRDVVVVSPEGAELTRLSIPTGGSVTNVAFGGPGRDVLYVTTLASGRGAAGLFRLKSAIPGMPY